MLPHQSFRARLRAFQVMRGADADPAFMADLAYLESRDLDLSVRLGAMLAFDALMVTIGTHPISASPGAPLSLDMASQPLLVVVSLISLIPFLLSILFTLNGLLVGEDFDGEGYGELSPDVLRHRLYAAFIASIDLQSRMLRLAVRSAYVGGAATVAAWALIMVMKLA